MRGSERKEKIVTLFEPEEAKHQILMLLCHRSDGRKSSTSSFIYRFLTYRTYLFYTFVEDVHPSAKEMLMSGILHDRIHTGQAYDPNDASFTSSSSIT
jgi:hypothetical protein